MDNDFEKGLQGLEDVLEEAWNLPFLNNKAVVDADKIDACISELRLRLPSEVRRAKELIQNKENMIKCAQDEAKRLLERAKQNAELITANAKANAEDLTERTRAYVEHMVSESEIVRQAQERANTILEQARTDAIKMRTTTLNYVDDALSASERALKESACALSRAKQSLKGE